MPHPRWLLALLLCSAAHAQTPPFDFGTLAGGPYASARVKLEKTVLNIDVATLDVRFGADTRDQLRSIAARGNTAAVRDAVARSATESRDAYVRLRFLRGFDFDRLLSETKKTVRCAWESGYIDQADYRRVVAGFPRWFGFLEGRGVRPGDTLLYRVQGDTMRTVYRAGDGRVLLDQTDAGPGPRRTLLASYFAPCSDFRKPLLKSLLRTP